MSWILYHDHLTFKCNTTKYVFRNDHKGELNSTFPRAHSVHLHKLVWHLLDFSVPGSCVYIPNVLSRILPLLHPTLHLLARKQLLLGREILHPYHLKLLVRLNFATHNLSYHIIILQNMFTTVWHKATFPHHNNVLRYLTSVTFPL